MLIYLAVLIPICMGTLALVLDFGLSATTARQMQSATDYGAIEGLRQRDSGKSEVEQRTAVADAMKMVFDDDMTPANGDRLNLGAGPILNSLAPGRTNLNASETLDFDNPTVYDPDPALNLLNAGRNEAHGDMVSGWYFDTARHDEGYNANPYDRNDFSPETSGGLQPFGSQEAFLVRMRRTTAFASGGLDNDSGIATAGPPVPAIFSRGSMLKGGAADDTGKLRHDGATVRATSIAAAHRAMSVGPTIPRNFYGPGAPANDVSGYAYFAIDEDAWNDDLIFPVGLYSNLIAVNPIGFLEIQGLSALEPVGQLHRTAQLVLPVGPNAEYLLVLNAQGFATPIAEPAVSLPFNIRVDNELMTVTDMIGGIGPLATIWRVERGQRGTTPQPHFLLDMIFLHEPLVFGDRIEPVDIAVNADLGDLLGLVFGERTYWVPIYSDQRPAAGRRVVGFGVATVSLSNVHPLRRRWLIRKESSMIAPINSSSIRTKRGFDDSVIDTPDVLENLLTSRRMFDEPLFAPSLVSSQSR